MTRAGKYRNCNMSDWLMSMVNIYESEVKMNKNKLKMLTSKQLESISLRWLCVIISKFENYGVSERAKAEVKRRQIKLYVNGQLV